MARLRGRARLTAEVLGDDGPFGRPASAWERRLAAAIVVMSALVVALVIPIANQPWVAIPTFVPAYQSAVAVNDLVTATLLFGLFREFRRPSLLVLGAGYLLTAPLVVAHTLSFPNLFVTGSLIGGPQTTVWLWLAWHVAFPVAAIIYASRVGRAEDAVPPDGGRALAVAVLLPLGLAALAILLATRGHDLLPPLLDGNRYLPGVTRPALAVPLALSAAALAVLIVRTRLRSALDLWLAVAVVAWGVEVFLGAVWNSGRFQAGFYVARLYGLFASCTVLVSLLLATVATHGRLARATVRERAAARAALSESETRYRSLFDSIDAGFCIIELAHGPDGRVDDYRFVEINPAFARQTGLADAQGRWVKSLVPDLERYWFDTYGRVARTGQPARFESVVEALGRWFEVYAFRVEPASTNRVALLFNDITRRREAELALAETQAELRRVNEGLETRVRQEVAAREATQAELAQAQRLEALGHLAGGVAHDVNNVLQVVSGGAALIERRAEDPPAVRRLARMVGDAVERGSAVTRRMLNFARQGDLRTEAVDAAALLEEMREMLSHTLGQGVAIRAASARPPVWAMVDKGQLETVLVNLAANARDAMADLPDERGGVRGTITLAVTAARRDGDGGWAVADAPGGGFVRLSVADTGAGMTPAVLARATEPFFTTKEVGKGTGLGLAMARGFAEQSGGGLTIESTLGRGTTVSLWLPAAESAPSEHWDRGRRSSVTDPGGAPAAGRILLVDDDATVREVLAQGLEAAGYEVVEAAGGAAALARLDGGEPADLLVSDLSMPGMDGLATIREAQRRRPGLPAILLTGFATEAVVPAPAAGEASFVLLRKPLPVRDLAQHIRAMLAKGADPAVAARSA